MIPQSSSSVTILYSCISEVRDSNISQVRDSNLYSDNGYSENILREFPVIPIIAAHLPQQTKLKRLQ